MNILKYGILFLGIVLTSCQSSRPYISPEASQKPAPVYEAGAVEEIVYLIGDAGKPALDGATEPTFVWLQTQLQNDKVNSTVVFLGDNVYPNGLPSESEKEKHQIAIRKLEEQFRASDAAEKRFVIAGNHDWNKGGKGGAESVKRQEAWVEKRLGDPSSFFPEQACPGPVSQKLNPSAEFYFLDTEWWLTPEPKERGCQETSEEQVIQQLENSLKQSDSEWKIVLGHHPVYSLGHHGGKYSFKDYCLPIPILMPLLRKTIGHYTDFAHKRYKNLRKQFISVFEKHENLIYVSGHDHNLQFFKAKGFYQVVSGSGSKSSYVARNPKAMFTSSQKGYSRLVFLKSNEIQVEFWAPKLDGKQGDLLYSYRISQTEKKF